MIQPEQVLEDELVTQLLGQGYDRATVTDETSMLANLKAELEAFNEVSLTDTTVKLTRGDVLVAYTDGLTETFDDDYEMFGDERLNQIVGALPPMPAQQLLDAIMKEVKTFSGGASQADDITLLVISCQSR